uniref:DUF1618 domain-containing protein n=1 Tax=Triticum aestivum TaxID=4565 RepID=A0A3B6LXB4_WHEAT
MSGDAGWPTLPGRLDDEDGARLPPECLLDRRVRTDFDDDDQQDLIALQPFKILRCVYKKALGFPSELQTQADEMVQTLQIGVHLAKSPPGLSCLGLRGGSPMTNIETVQDSIVVLTTTFLHDFDYTFYLVYEASSGSLHMIPMPENPCFILTGLSASMLIARSFYTADYALVVLGKLDGQEGDVPLVWLSSSSSPSWSEIKTTVFSQPPSLMLHYADMGFTIGSMACWVDLLRGVAFSWCNTLFPKDCRKEPTLNFGFFSLPRELPGADHCRGNTRVAQPEAYRTIGVVQGFIRFVSIDGFLDYVDLKDRTLTVWKRTLNRVWQLEYKLSLETLWGLQGFGDLPKNLTPMYPLLSTENTDIVYFALGEYLENRRRWKFIPICAHYLLAVNMQSNTVQASISLADCFGSPDIPDLVSSSFSRYVHVVGHDLHIMMMDTMKQMASIHLDPIDYDEREARKVMRESPFNWQGTLKDKPIFYPARYYSQPSLLRLTQSDIYFLFTATADIIPEISG